MWQQSLTSQVLLILRIPLAVYLPAGLLHGLEEPSDRCQDSYQEPSDKCQDSYQPLQGHAWPAVVYCSGCYKTTCLKQPIFSSGSCTLHDVTVQQLQHQATCHCLRGPCL